ncbi:type VI secretion system baseplate subunit TssE [Agaribacterium haliotis]|uniref:type VI secretion system baseplate subunit TssE n=1 Tax=Agaribacterium haliotis TaxID=2013869 RepID=UPI000BB5525F|nr:type VI secretion system baseplate subunit TssE [Agaribacterium haliotis]
MRSPDTKTHLRASLFDRLRDDEPHLEFEAAQTQHQQLKELRASVRRDLEKLLNTRFRVCSADEKYPNLQESLLNFGLPDLATINIIDIDKKRAFTAQLERILRQFEPRFKSVKVSHLDNRESTDRTLRFRIDATLYADPVPEVVVFDSILEPASRSVNVEESQHA